MTPFPTEALDVAGKHLLSEIQIQTQTDMQEEEPKTSFCERLDKQAKTVLTVVKATEALLDLNDKLAKRNDDSTYTRLEDLPPLHPDDEARLKEEFYALANRVSQSGVGG